MDRYAHLRQISLLTLFQSLGIASQWKSRKSGTEFYGRCPHPNHNPKQNQTSFSFDLDGKFYCFGCQWKGRGAIDAARGLKDCNFTAATELLESLAITPSPEPKRPAVTSNSDANDTRLKPFTGKYHMHQVELPWLEARCPDKAIRERFGVFAYSNPARKSKYQNKVFIPLKDLEGTLYGYLVRTPEPTTGESKYEFPVGFPKSRFLFGAYELQEGAPHRYVVIAESPFCCLKYAMWGIPCVSPFGWSLSAEQIDILLRLARAAVYLPDRNKSGQESANVVQSLGRRLWVKCPELPNGKEDPESLTESELRAILPKG